MADLVALEETEVEFEPALLQPVDEAVWAAWVIRGRAKELQSDAAVVRAVAWIATAALVCAAAVWSQAPVFVVIVKFLVAGGAMVGMLHQWHLRRFPFAALFGAILLLYNPLVQVFGFSGDWQRVAVLLTAVPFVLSLVWREGKPAGNV